MEMVQEEEVKMVGAQEWRQASAAVHPWQQWRPGHISKGESVGSGGDAYELRQLQPWV
jgi:hypothetical protein